MHKPFVTSSGRSTIEAHARRWRQGQGSNVHFGQIGLNPMASLIADLSPNHRRIRGTPLGASFSTGGVKLSIQAQNVAT